MILCNCTGVSEDKYRQILNDINNKSLSYEDCLLLSLIGEGCDDSPCRPRMEEIIHENKKEKK